MTSAAAVRRVLSRVVSTARPSSSGRGAGGGGRGDGGLHPGPDPAAARLLRVGDTLAIQRTFTADEVRPEAGPTSPPGYVLPQTRQRRL